MVQHPADASHFERYLFGGRWPLAAAADGRTQLFLEIGKVFMERAKSMGFVRVFDTDLLQLGFLHSLVQHDFRSALVAAQRNGLRGARHAAVPLGGLLFDLAGAGCAFGDLPAVSVKVADDGFLVDSGHGVPFSEVPAPPYASDFVQADAGQWISWNKCTMEVKRDKASRRFLPPICPFVEGCIYFPIRRRSVPSSATAVPAARRDATRSS